MKKVDHQIDNLMKRNSSLDNPLLLMLSTRITTTDRHRHPYKRPFINNINTKVERHRLRENVLETHRSVGFSIHTSVLKIKNKNHCDKTRDQKKEKTFDTIRNGMVLLSSLSILNPNLRQRKNLKILFGFGLGTAYHPSQRFWQRTSFPFR